jgi:hypothetical protein
MVGARLQLIACENEEVWMAALGRTLHVFNSRPEDTGAAAARWI